MTVKQQELLLLLRQAAELEHQLMVQYLFAAYSLKTEPDDFDDAPGLSEADREGFIERNRGWRDQVLSIAREEMGHLITVQKEIISLGGRPHFERDSFPIKPLYDPFEFTLEPISRNSLAKYLWTEKPREGEELTRDDLLGDERAEIEAEVYRRRPNELGILYASILRKLDEIDGKVFGQDVENQTDVASWPGLGKMAFVERIEGKSSAIEAIEKVVDQGEGHRATEHSHFERFREMYLAFRKSGDHASKDIAINPNTAEPDRGGHDTERARALEGGHIGHPETLRWAKLFNKRYAILMAELNHALMIPDVAPHRPAGDRARQLARVRFRRPGPEPEPLPDQLPSRLVDLARKEVEALTPGQIKGLTIGQIGDLTPSQSRCLTDRQLEALTPIQLENLLLKGPEAFIEHQLVTISLIKPRVEQRDELIRWARDEMTLVIAPLANWLTKLPVSEDQNSKRAGAPFELEGTGPSLSIDEQARWYAHQRMIDESRRLVDAFEAGDDRARLLPAIRAIDDRRADFIAAQLGRIYEENRKKVRGLVGESP